MFKRVDANQQQIIKALRKIGATVQPLHEVGKGCPDILVGFKGKNHLFEIKDGKKPPSATRLTPDEKRWHESWRGSIQVIYRVEDAIRYMNI